MRTPFSPGLMTQSSPAPPETTCAICVCSSPNDRSRGQTLPPSFASGRGGITAKSLANSNLRYAADRPPACEISSHLTASLLAAIVPQSLSAARSSRAPIPPDEPVVDCPRRWPWFPHDPLPRSFPHALRSSKEISSTCQSALSPSAQFRCSSHCSSRALRALESPKRLLVRRAHRSPQSESENAARSDSSRSGL